MRLWALFKNIVRQGAIRPSIGTSKKPMRMKKLGVAKTTKPTDRERETVPTTLACEVRACERCVREVGEGGRACDYG